MKFAKGLEIYNRNIRKYQFQSFKLQFIIKFVPNFSGSSSKFCNKLYVNLFSCMEIPCQLYEKKGNFMLFKFVPCKFFFKRLNFFKNLKKPDPFHKKQCYFWRHNRCLFQCFKFSPRHMSATLVKIAN